MLRRPGHSLAELIVAMVASAVLLVGLGSVMLIARQVAFTPSAAHRRTQSAQVFYSLVDELQYATLILQQTPRILEFVVADRNADGTAERIRYEWSGTLGDPLYKTVNGGTAVVVAHRVQQFQLDYTVAAAVTALQATVDSSEAALASFGGTGNINESAATTNWLAQHVDPQSFPATVGTINKSSALAWNATRITFQSTGALPLAVELRETGDLNGPTNHVLGRVNLATANANEATFSSPIKGLSFSRKYAVVIRPDSANPVPLVLKTSSGARTAFRTSDMSTSWQVYPDRQANCTIYGTYTAAGTSYNVTRNYVSRLRVMLQLGADAHARIDASIPLANAPELLSAYWRADFDANPTTANANGDGVADWAQPSGTFDSASLVAGTWRPANALETRPLHDFTNVTTVEARFRNTTVGGNGAVLRINADRQGGQYAPLLVYLQLQTDGTQALTLSGKSSDANTTKLFARQRLANEPTRVKLTILPASNVVNLQINGEDQGTFTYPTYAPLSSSDRYLTLFADTSQAEFDYVEARVGTN